MKRLLRIMLAVGSSRAVPPVVIGLFFVFYIGVAFFTDETLITLMAFTRRSVILAAILALIPLNSLFRLVSETIRQRDVSRIFSGKTLSGMAELCDDVVELPPCRIPDIEGRLAAVGYNTRRIGSTVSAWRGVGLFPARLLFLAGTFCLFTGILVSTTTKSAQRQMVTEGEPFPTPNGVGGIVERIILAQSTGLFLKRTLTMEVAASDYGTGKKTFGLYPPGLYDGAFVYPRYLGLTLHFRFSAPDLPTEYETSYSLNAYPPGKEDSVAIPDSPYRIVFSVPVPDVGEELYVSYLTDTVTLQFKLLKGKDVLFTGTAPRGGEFVRDGYRLSLPDIRRLVVTDFISDYGVLFIWWSALLFAVAVCIWLPVRLFLPRRLMVFRSDDTGAVACSLAEGGMRKHAGVFHELLDFVDAKNKGGKDDCQ
ncbi:MAG: hypothetical protein PHY09_16550 [Desulfuromonadaceae bacterium]|nr:hypothetical protein [Desulfuromonadaceae bacterium]MDD5106930.1 hypothetical protein [Desulfuromonadaceae bacterium]